MKKLLLIAFLALVTTSCGVKNDLEKPNGTIPPKTDPNPSKPPFPIGR